MILATLKARMRLRRVNGTLASRRVRQLTGFIMTVAIWSAGLSGLASPASAQPPSSCTVGGSSAYCVAAEAGPYLYQAADDGYAVGQGPDEASALAAYQAAFYKGYSPCTFNLNEGTLPAWQPVPAAGAGGKSSGNYADALYYAEGQYWSLNYVLSVEESQLVLPITLTGTGGYACDKSFGPMGVYVNRDRTVICPGSIYGPYREDPTTSFCFRAATAVDPRKNIGSACPTTSAGGSSTSCSATSTSQNLTGDPTNPSTGNQFLPETDYIGPGPMPLGFVRYYNSQLTTWNTEKNPSDSAQVYTTLGPNWRSSYDRSIQFANSVVYPTAYVYRPDGRLLYFGLSNGQWIPDADVSDQLVELTNGSGSITGWQYTIAANDEVETYNASGQLVSLTSRSGLTQTLTYNSSNLLAAVTDSFGHTLTFSYDSSNRLSTLTDPAGNVYTYSYNSVNNVASVTHPDSTVRTYVYNEQANTDNTNLPYAMTGIVDESNTRFATYQYDSQGRITSTFHAGPVETYSFSYGSYTYGATAQTSVTDPLGTKRTYNYSTLFGAQRNTSIGTTPCPSTCGGSAASSGYDTNGNVASRTDFNGNLTTYVYNLTRNLETSRTEASGTSVARTITTQWNPSYREPTQITEPTRVTAFTYDSMGNVLTKTITDTTVTPNVARTWTYTYDSYGRMLTAQGPRTDVNSTTTYTYYTCTTGSQCGELQTVTDPVGNVTTYNTYNAHGQPLTITDPNGVVTTLTYDARLRLTSRQVGTETTTFSYYPTGLLKQVTLPDSSYVLYTYDNAHRLTEISDGAGNSIQYTLDAMGNRTAEKTYDPSGTLHRTHTRAYNTLNELYQDVNAAGTSAVTTTYGYDSNANQTSIAAPLSRNTANTYDPLNRLSQITDPNSGLTSFSYDAADDLTSVKDPRSLTTSYGYDGFGDVVSQVSPDTGTTANTYDSGGNLSTSTDARGAVSAYTYDAANRVTSITYSAGGVADQTIDFGYDQGTNGRGRLTSASDANHSLAWSYDFLGRVVGKGLTVGTVNLSIGYAYTNGDLTALVTPSGQAVAYGFNANHQVTSLTINGTTVLSGVTYEPFGGVNGWTWGDGTTTTRTFNGDGLISQIVTAGVTLGYSFDNANRISGITDSSNSALSWTYGYDLLDRLTSATTSAITEGWTYDADGNQLTETGTTPITFTPSTSSNQLTATTGSLVRAYTYDAAGHTQAYGTLSFSYNNRGRMEATSASSTDYLYNALGQMIEKSGTLGTTTFMQDEAGHLIGEYDGSGNLIEETIWLGDVPVATLEPNGSGGVNIFYIHTDHLNAPRKVQQPVTDALVWRWDTDPFGTAAPNENPAGLGTFPYNLRFPGQYYQAETGLNQNYSRDYDPLTGKYVESDLIGQHGGLDTYVYVGESPTDGVDPLGTLRQGSGFSGPSDPRWQSIQQAEAKIRKELQKASACHRNPNQDSCIPPFVADNLNNLLYPFASRLDLSIVSFDPNTPSNECASGATPGWTISVGPQAYTSNCACLASTLYHELLHNIGLQHYPTSDGPGIYDLESRCMGNLCGRSTP
jgi:RHS repeat-associated protein